jgi:molybdenum cofactor guanylyltransferase
MMASGSGPIGVVLAGGLGRRIGGAKATVRLHGEPLIAYPLSAMRAALEEVAIVAKADTELPSLPGITLWVEPDAPRHPLAGVRHALGLAEGRPVLVCALDLPLVSADLIRRLANADAGGAPAVVARGAGQIQPLLGCYYPQALSRLPPVGPAREAVAGLAPAVLEVEDPDVLFNVNTPDDLLQAAAMLDARRRAARPRPGYPNVKS